MLGAPEKVKIAVLVSGGGTNLQALIDAQRKGIIRSGKIALVVSSVKGAYALKRASDAGIKTAVCARADYAGADAFENAMLRELEAAGAGLVVLAGFTSILGHGFISRYKNRIINVHPSLIPAFCGKGFYGLKVHEAALRRGVKVTGATVHYVNEIPDGGKIIFQKAVDVLPQDTPETLQRRVMEQAEWELLPRAAELVSAEILKRREKI